MLDHSGVSVARGSRRQPDAENGAGPSRRPARAEHGQSDRPSLPRTVRLQDIADRAHVSRATVSLALRNDASIPLVTRARIQAVADGLDYRPNPLVSALMTYQRTAKAARKTHLTLAMLLPFSRRGPNRSEVPESLLEAAAERAQQHGYRLEEFWLSDLHLSGPRLEEVLYSRGVPGVLVVPFAPGLGDLRLDWSRFAAVAVGSPLPYPQLHRVSANCIEGMRAAVRRLREMGCQRIGLALPASCDERVDGHWSAGFLSEQQQIAASQRVPILIVRDECWTERSFCRWYASRQPDVVLSPDVAAIGWLEKMGRRVPDDAGFVQLPVGLTRQNYTGIDLNPSGVGAVAVDLLVEMIRRNERGVPASPQTVLLETRWVDGKTTRRKLMRTAVYSGRSRGKIDVKLDFGPRGGSAGYQWTLGSDRRDAIAGRDVGVLEG